MTWDSKHKHIFLTSKTRKQKQKHQCLFHLTECSSHCVQLLLTSPHKPLTAIIMLNNKPSPHPQAAMRLAGSDMHSWMCRVINKVVWDETEMSPSGRRLVTSRSTARRRLIPATWWAALLRALQKLLLANCTHIYDECATSHAPPKLIIFFHSFFSEISAQRGRGHRLSSALTSPGVL